MHSLKKPLLTLIVLILGFGLLYSVVWWKTQQSVVAADTKVSDDSQLGLQIAKREAQLATRGTASGYAEIAMLYIEKARQSADSSWYTLAKKAVERGTAIDDTNTDLLAAGASLAIGQHDFALAKELTLGLIEIQPTIAQYYGILGDAEIELGQYESAAEAFQKMVDLKPNYSAFSRIAYIREIYGDVDGSVFALQRALSAGSPYQDNIAYAHNELAKLALRSDLTKANEQAAEALRLVPNYAPALKTISLTQYFDGQLEEAIETARTAFNTIPSAEYAAMLGLLLSKNGDAETASLQYTLAKLAFLSARSGGTNVDSEEAVFLLDHFKKDTAESVRALTLSKSAYVERPSVLTQSVLAYAYLKNNKIDEALAQIEPALEGVGQYSAVTHYRAAEIYAAANNNNRAKEEINEAKEINPHILEYSDVSSIQ